MLKSVRNRQADALTRLSWQDFERLLADHYRDLGYDVQHHGTGSTGARSDGGIDLKLRKGEQYLLVQCKHWNAMQVPHNDVHQLMGIMDNEDATGAILVTSGEFTPAARAAAEKKGKVALIDGVALRQMLGSRLPPDLPPPPLGLPRESDLWVTPDSRPTRARRRGKRDVSIEKAVIAVVGFVLIVVLILFAANRMLAVFAGLGPKPSRTAASAPERVPSSHPGSSVTAGSSGMLQRAGQADALRTAADLAKFDAAAAAGNQEQARQAFDTAHRGFMRDAKIADVRFPVNHEAARQVAKQIAGIRSAVWLDRENLLLIVERNDLRSQATIDQVCRSLQPLGDTLGVVVNLQSGAAQNGDELEVLSRNCQLAPGDRAFMQSNRQVDAIAPGIRAQQRASNGASTTAKPTTEESMRVLERTTPQLKD